MSKRFVLAAMLLATPAIATAQPPAPVPAQYWGVNIGDFDFTNNGASGNSTAIGLRGGYHFSDFLGVELRGGFDTGGDKGGLQESPDVIHGGAYVRLDLPFERVNVFFLGGTSVVRYDSVNGTKDTSDVSGGIGIELYGSDRTALTLDYMNYSDGAYEGVSLGLVHHFDWPRFR